MGRSRVTVARPARSRRKGRLTWLLAVSLGILPAAGATYCDAAVSMAGMPHLVHQIQATSFGDLATVDVRVRGFHAASDYLRTRFSVPRFVFLLPMRYFVEVNPEAFARQAPADGLCAIVAHELVHVRQMSRGNRIRILGFVRMLSRSYTTKLERATDREAIRRGYGRGLIAYRRWLYANIPAASVAAKRRDYLMPEEIVAAMQ